MENAAREALAALRPPVGCATVRRACGEPPAGWEDAACERLRVAEGVNADLREELGMARADSRDAEALVGAVRAERAEALRRLDEIQAAARDVVDLFDDGGRPRATPARFAPLVDRLERFADRPPPGVFDCPPLVDLDARTDQTSKPAVRLEVAAEGATALAPPVAQPAPSDAQAGSCGGPLA